MPIPVIPHHNQLRVVPDPAVEDGFTVVGDDGREVARLVSLETRTDWVGDRGLMHVRIEFHVPMTGKAANEAEQLTAIYQHMEEGDA